MATTKQQLMDKRGPRIGDAASLWNFTPAPGWEKEEVQILKLCLMKFGIGQWLTILNTGLLPGKLIQQLNGQTQRLLGQQSLAAYTGLQVDIDRIRADNEARTDVQRKSGLIINSGSNPTKEVKAQWRQEARQKYGLDVEQLKEVDEQLEEFWQRLQAVGLDSGQQQGSSKPIVHIYDSDASQLSKVVQVQLLKRLQSKLCCLVAELKAQLGLPATVMEDTLVDSNGNGGNGNDAVQVEFIEEDVAAQGATAVGHASGRPIVQHMMVHELNAAGRKPGSNRPAAARKVPNPGRLDQKRYKPRRANTKRRRGDSLSDNDDAMADGIDSDDFQSAVDSDEPAVTRKSSRNACTSVVQEARHAVLQADLELLQGMGFSARMAKDALLEAQGDVDMAIDWLFAHCA